MKRCKKNILLIFGYLLLMAILFPPIESGYLYSKTKYVFFPTHILDSLIVKNAGILGEGYVNYGKLSTELAVILFIGGFTYIVFCLVLKKDKGTNKQSGA